MFFFGPFGFSLILPVIIFVVVARLVSRYRRQQNTFVPPGTRRDMMMPGQSTPLLRGASQDARIFKLAYKLKGTVTLSDIVVETGMTLHDAQQVVESMVDNAHVRMEVDDQLGTVTYEFPEIIRRFETES
jgi:hypothetical protein